MNSLDKMEEEKVMEQHLSQYREWCEQRGIILSEESENTYRDGFKDGIAHANSKHSAILEDYDRLAKLCEKQAATIAMQAEALKIAQHMLKPEESETIEKALSASAESIAAWEAEHAAKVLEDAADSVEFDNDNPADDMVKDTLRRMAAEYRATNKEQET